MRKISIMLAVVLAALLVMSSCGDPSSKISSGEISDLFNKEAARLQIDKQYVEIDTGYYEVSSKNERLVLEKLANAGVITYSVERFAWWTECMTIKYDAVVKIEDTYYEGENDVLSSREIKGRDTVPEYSYEEHFMVDVRITDKYKKMIKDTAVVDDVDPDLVLPKYNPKDWAYDTLELSENWPVIAEPKAPEVPHVRKEIKKPEPVVRNEEKREEPANREEKVEKPEPVKYPICKSMDQATADKFEAAQAKENKGTVKLLAYAIKAVKARNIQIVNKEDGSKGARAEVILNIKEVTPQGHILHNAVVNDIPTKTDVNLTYYVDKGWTLDSCAIDMVSIESIINNVQINYSESLLEENLEGENVEDEE